MLPGRGVTLRNTYVDIMYMCLNVYTTAQTPNTPDPIMRTDPGGTPRTGDLPPERGKGERTSSSYWTDEEHPDPFPTHSPCRALTSAADAEAEQHAA